MIKSLSAILKSLGKWDYDEIQINNPNNDQALVKVSQCGICSTDVVRSMEVGFYNYPIVPGHEIIGKIYKLGKNSKNFKEGDKVCVYPLITKCHSDDCCAKSESAYGHQVNKNQCSTYDFLGSRSHGGYSEYILTPIKNLVKIPSNLSDDLSVFTEPSSVALHALRIAQKDRKFDSVIILGLGPIGILLAAWCKKFKISNIIGVDRNKNRFQNFFDVGCDKIIDTRKDNVIKKIKNFTNNSLSEVSFECSGSEELLNTSIDGLKKGGKIVILSNQIRDIKLSREVLNKILRQELTIAGSWSSIIDPVNEWEESLEFLKKNPDIKKLISHKYNFSSAKKVFPSMYNKEFKFSKIVLKP
ncbi:MAG: hypothetical protein CMI79_03170 [Candidatus Pelagibacter sp.]|nr:hypothetical protein [Candidatus Pelagibacter sp.]|tara:strand:- start:1729 stop:2799 length:1071 start_codon:yes stop_codon:yes gene_type:complete